MRFEFGKHKNERLDEVPIKYLNWLLSHRNVLAVRNRWILVHVQSEINARKETTMTRRRMIVEGKTFYTIQESVGSGKWKSTDICFTMAPELAQSYCSASTDDERECVLSIYQSELSRRSGDLARWNSFNPR